jgi:hypothetical protein
MNELYPKPPAGFLFLVGYLLLLTTIVGNWIIYLALS